MKGNLGEYKSGDRFRILVGRQTITHRKVGTSTSYTTPFRNEGQALGADTSLVTPFATVKDVVMTRPPQ